MKNNRLQFGICLLLLALGGRMVFADTEKVRELNREIVLLNLINGLYLTTDQAESLIDIIVEADMVREAYENYVCAIATSKDHQSVDILLRKYKLTDCFQRENILDKEFAESKRDHLTQFHEKHNVPFKDIHFIDDKVSHLIKVKDLGVQAYLAVWGFNTEREHEIALEHGFKLLRLEALGDMASY